MFTQLSSSMCNSDDCCNSTTPNNSNSSTTPNNSNSSINCSSNTPNHNQSLRCIDQPDFYTYDRALAAAASMPKILGNGCKVFGPPGNWSGTRPSYLCELFLTRVPDQLDESSFLVWMHRFGTVYEFRLMMDSCNQKRGYAFVRYSKECEAKAACELIGFRYHCAQRMGVFRSHGKNRLYVSNIPKQLPIIEIKMGFQQIFPLVQDIVVYAPKQLLDRPTSVEQNRGYAFIEFYNHEEALEAKKRSTPGCVRMWGTDLKVQWAKPRLNVVADKQGLRSTSHFNCRWVNMQPLVNDYCAKLRLCCLANDWCIPVVIYGRNCRQADIQYGGILLKSAINGPSCCLIMELCVERVYDSHLLLCEVAMLLIERAAGFPQSNYLLKVQQHQAEIALSYVSNTALLTFYGNVFHNFAAITELVDAMSMLAQISSQILQNLYRNSFIASYSAQPCLTLGAEQQQYFKQKIYTILPQFRNNPPLKCNLNDAQINLMLETWGGCTDCPLMLQRARAITSPTAPPPSLISQTLSLAANALRIKSQRSNPHSDYRLRFVDSQQHYRFYHSAQQINMHPIWIAGHTYQQSLYNSLQNDRI